MKRPLPLNILLLPSNPHDEGKNSVSTESQEIVSLGGVPCFLPFLKQEREFWVGSWIDYAWQLKIKGANASSAVARAGEIAIKEWHRFGVEVLGLALPSPKQLPPPLSSGRNFIGRNLGMIARDWVWGGGEIQSQLKILGDIGPGLWLIAGAGSGGLACALAETFPKTRFVALDHNPWTLCLGSALAHGKEFSLVEWIDDPVDAQSWFVQHQLKIKKTNPENLDWIVADFFDGPFMPHSFDGLITPWFVDILPMGIEQIFNQAQKLLKPGGEWKGFGPWSFQHLPEKLRPFPNDLKKSLESEGFKIARWEEFQSLHLANPKSSSHRLQKQMFWEATVAKPSVKILSPGPASKSQKIPRGPEIENQQGVYEFYAQVLKRIDGNTTSEELALWVSQNFGLPHAEAKEGIERFLSGILIKSKS